MKTKIQGIFTLILLISSNIVGVYSASANMSLVQPRVNQIQAADLGLPSGVSEPKGIFGTIIANLFDSSARIKAEFLTNIIPSVTTNNVPKWNGTTFVNSNVTDNGSNVGINSQLRVNGTNWFYLQNNGLYGDNGTALYYNSNNGGATQMIFRDVNSVLYGSVYGSGTGTYFGLLDGDGDWSYLAQKNTLTQLRINNSVVAEFTPTGTFIGPGQMEVGWNRTGNRYAYTDYIGDDTYTDYGLRVMRGNTGPNTFSILEHRGTGDFIMNAMDAGTLRLRTNNADRLIVAPNTGDVTMNGRLDVVGSIRNTTTATPQQNGAELYLTGAAGGWASTIGGAAFAVNTGNNGARIERMRIDINGNVGIGQTPTTDKLAVTGNIAATGDIKAARLCNAAGASCVSLPITAGNIDGGGSANLVARFSDADTLSTGVIKDDGTNVGIGLGAGSPTQKLDVNGYIRVRSINGEGGTISLDGNNGSTVHVENLNGVFRTLDSAWTRTNFSVDQSGNGFLNGNLGLGMGASHRLDVNGNARVNNTLYFVNNTQRLTGDSSSALYYYANHSTVTQQLFHDAEGTLYGRVYGDGDGVNFGLISADGNWQVRTWNTGVELYDTSYANDFRSYIYYDRNDTNYYADPASTSYFNDFRPNIIYDRNDTSYYVDPNATSRFATTYSTIMYDTNDGNYYMDPNYVSRLNDIRPNIMYDGQDTTYYVDPNGTTNLVNFRTVGSNTFNNASPTITFQDTDHRGGSIHVNSNQFYVLSAPAGVNTTGWTANGSYRPLQIDLNSDQATFGGNIWVPEGSVKTSCVGNCF